MMLHKIDEDGAWFAPKRYGLGIGCPVAWQGWLVMAAYVAALAGIGLIHKSSHSGTRPASFALFLLVTGLFMVVVARRTRGGWKWRWGGKE